MESNHTKAVSLLRVPRNRTLHLVLGDRVGADDTGHLIRGLGEELQFGSVHFVVFGF